MRSHRPTKKNPLPGTFYTHTRTQKGYRKKIDLRPCLLVPNVVEKKVFVIQKIYYMKQFRISWYTISEPVQCLKKDIMFECSIIIVIIELDV